MTGWLLAGFLALWLAGAIACAALLAAGIRHGEQQARRTRPGPHTPAWARPDRHHDHTHGHGRHRR